MHVSVVLSVVTAVVKYIAATETTNQPSDEGAPSTKRPVNENAHSMDLRNANPHLNSLWTYQVKAASFDQKEAVEEKRAHRLSVFRPPQSVTRLAKSLSLGFDPYFNKGYFEPFERRPKPVTLIGIRKNGLLPRKTIFAAAEASKSSESAVAELQSPFNEISSFWLSQPGYN